VTAKPGFPSPRTVREIPVDARLDGELVAFGTDGAPDFPLVCERMLMRRAQIPMTFVVFDLLRLAADSLMTLTYSERGTDLEALDLNAPHWTTPESLEDGGALFEAVCAHELEGIVAKRRSSGYRSCDRGVARAAARRGDRAARILP
jgi:bifunctional non-homologous end joining protein LigD